jgi:hypothetical protein
MMQTLRYGVLVLAVTIFSNCSDSSTANVKVAGSQALVPVGSMRVARLGHTATLLPGGKVLVAGGSGGAEFLASAELFDPSKGTFTQTANMTTKRAGHTATLLRSGKVLIIGGAQQPDTNLASAEVFDPATGVFTATGNMRTARTDHSATLLQDGRVLVAGGSEVWPQSLASAELYDPKTGEFTPTGDMTAPRRPAGVVLLKNGRVLVAGGTGKNKSVLASAELYNPATGTFALTGNMTARRHKHAASVLPDGNVLITGGSDEDDWKGVYATSEIFDPEKGEFRRAADMKSPHFKHRSVALPDGRIAIVGGSKLVEIYDPVGKRFEVADGDLGKPYFFPSATVLENATVLISGGYDEDNNTINRAWILKNK